MGSNQVEYPLGANGWVKSVPYLIVLMAALALKVHYSHAGSDDLRWILTPVARLVEGTYDMAFTYEAATGFVDYYRRIIISPGCAGVNFMVVALCMTAFTVLPLSRTMSGRLAWLGISAISAYLLTLIANTLRIGISIGLYQADIYGPWITAARVHRMAGLAVYLFLLCGFFALVSRLKPQLPIRLKHSTSAFIPLLWYFGVTIGIPLLNGAYFLGTKRFLEHSVMVLTGGVIVFLCFNLLNRAYRALSNHLPGGQ